MKIRTLTLAVLVAAASAQSGHADQEILITGATAFRKASIDAIVALFDSVQVNALANSYNYATSANGVGTNVVNAAGASTFKGTFPGITGVTTIRCSWNGSVEGIRALVSPGATYNAKYIQDAGIVGAGANYSKSATTQQAADFAFSDVLQSSTPELTPTLNGGSVGVVIFSLLANKGSTLSSITTNQFKDLFGNGYTKKSLLTGNSTDTTRVYAIGRNDGSGTRTTYLSSTGLGVTSKVKQYAATTTANGTFSAIQLIPDSGTGVNSDGNVIVNGTPVTDFKSTIWGNDFVGNGGYQSGGTLGGVMQMTSSGNVTVKDEYGDAVPALSGGSVDLVTFMAAGDIAANVANVKVLAFNGVTVTPQSSGAVVSSTDKAKVTSGAYEAWGTENLYYRGTIGTVTGGYKTFYDALKLKLADSTIVDASGVTLGEMNVARTPTDGGIIGPKTR
ncbi:MAG: hypothetical protein NTV93_16015 [Verrucomicrobia bacterium]|nr:hypothetical protein [Verrucomicrobiota bacterium]